MDQSDASQGQAASELISRRIAELADWRGETLARMRRLIKDAAPDVVEEWKWRGTPVWSYDGIICTGETYKKVVKLTFARGASLDDPAGLFNSSLEGNVRRAIDIHEGEEVDEADFKALVGKAVALNSSRKSRPSRAAKPGAAAGDGKRPTAGRNGTSVTAGPKLLAGGNPQIAKADGDAPVQAYIAAMPGWKRETGSRLDALIVRTVPEVRKAVKWNSPFYGVEGQGWFLNFHCFTRYVKVAFFRGSSLQPLPPGESKDKDVRYLDIHEGDQLDEDLVASWIRQASELPGWVP
ncbi:MAG: DUF1801 domain-containing protein [Dehalococcoidia bacterium]|uniref:DUF1801 domain-containing protein n=1 Tax=Candidatus Amarobacter glycogenicus TaxID=3140699 RepID=UPI0031376A97|nr:DUF1801 domain-containing protein [Dehalococcoidia bacterium]MBK9343872.1 DUF1801 domain-containing protein [Dehalococcoidia bacterium]